VKINSGSYNLAGLDKLATVVKRELQVLESHVEEIELPSHQVIDSSGALAYRPLGKALSLRKRSDAPIQVFLGIHMDTVYDRDHPFQAVTELSGNRLQGPGVADAKGGLVVMFFALQAFERSPFREALGWEILINPDEEIGSPGSFPLLARAAGRNDIGLVYEPCLPNGGLIGARKGSGNYTLVVRGRSAHAGRDPHRGHNAIDAIAECIIQLKNIPDVVPGVSVNVGLIEGGRAVNVVPDLAIAQFNVRVENRESQEGVEERLRHICDRINQQEGISLESHGGFYAPSKPLDHKTLGLLNHLAACGRDLGMAIEWMPSGGVCDGNKLAAAGLTTVDTLGVRGDRIHSSDEFVYLESLTERAKLSALLLMKLGLGHIECPN